MHKTVTDEYAGRMLLFVIDLLRLLGTTVTKEARNFRSRSTSAQSAQN